MRRYKTQKFRSSVVLTFNEIDIYSCEFFLFKEWVEVRNLLSLLVKSFPWWKKVK